MKDGEQKQSPSSPLKKTGRGGRQAKIIELITKYEIETQSELVEALGAASYAVTQATISRDIKELGLIKVMTDSKKYKYALERADSGLKAKMTVMFREAVISIDSADNLIVIKTLSGSANTAGMLVDKLGLENVLGCVAGDDTVLVIVRNAASAKSIVNKLNAII
ncbi:MAG: arginine repressor [Firmicutes bacterium]|nr:arginine repressor [Bacillota bacterium]